MKRMALGDAPKIKEGFEDESICSTCGGKCCKRVGCAFIPQDFDNISDAFKGIHEGKYSIVIDTMETFNYYIRMRNKLGAPLDIGMTGECKALHELGCSFSFEERPYEGRMLKPSSETSCKSNVTSEDLGKAWEPYQTELNAIVEELGFLYSKDRLNNLGMLEIKDKIKSDKPILANLISYMQKYKSFSHEFDNYKLEDYFKNLYTRSEINFACELILIEHRNLVETLASSYGLYSKDILAILCCILIEELY